MYHELRKRGTGTCEPLVSCSKMDHDLNTRSRLAFAGRHEPDNNRDMTDPFRLLFIAILLLVCEPTRAAEPAEIKIGYLRVPEPKITLSLLQTPADNDGLAGAQMAIDDNNTTGRFLNQRFPLDDPLVGAKDDPAAAAL